MNRRMSAANFTNHSKPSSRVGGFSYTFRIDFTTALYYSYFFVSIL